MLCITHIGLLQNIDSALYYFRKSLKRNDCYERLDSQENGKPVLFLDYFVYVRVIVW